MIAHAKAVFFFKFSNNLLPASFSGQWLTGLQRFPDLHIRNSPLYCIITPQREFVKRLPLFSLPVHWNNIASHTDIYQEDQSLKSFSRAYRKHLIDELPPYISCTRANCPECSLN